MKLEPATRQDLLRPRLKRFTRLLHLLEDGDARAVHLTRVSSRRLRELLPVLQLDSDLAGKLGKRLRRITRALGPVREADVLLQLIEHRQAAARDGDVAALRLVAEHVRARGARARRQAVDHETLAELRKLARKLHRVEKRLADAPVTSRERRAWRWALEARACRRADALRTAIRRAGAVYLPERLHDVRIALKKVRYAVELVNEATGRSRAQDLRSLKRLQDTLGRLHDSEVLLEQVRQTQASSSPPDLIAWRQLDRLVRALEHDCRRLHARYMRERPALETLCHRLVDRPAAPARRTG